MLFLSIIIPCHNVANFLPDTINSLCSLRNAQKCEFIFVNDGSTDTTLSIIDDFARKDKRVVIIDQKNAGVSNARNAAIQIAKGRYILPLDGDDRLRIDAIENIQTDIENADLLITPIEKIRPERSYIQKLYIKNGKYSPSELYQKCTYFPTAPKLIYRTSIIRKHNILFDEDIHSGEVYTFTCHFLRYCTSIIVSSHCFYQYIMRQSSATHMPNYNKDLSVLTIIDRIISYSEPTIQDLPSFNVTLFRMCNSFTYVKYAQAGVTDPQAINVIRQMILYPKYQKCIRKVAFSIGKHHRERLMALYILTTKLWGYKLLARIGPIFASLRRKQFS